MMLILLLLLMQLKLMQLKLMELQQQLKDLFIPHLITPTDHEMSID